MKRILTVKAMDKFVKGLSKKTYSWHSFKKNKRYSHQGFCVVVRDNNFYGSIHITATGEIHGFNQNKKKPEFGYWSKRYKFNSVVELQNLYQYLYRRIHKTQRTRF